ASKASVCASAAAGSRRLSSDASIAATARAPSVRWRSHAAANAGCFIDRGYQLLHDLDRRQCAQIALGLPAGALLREDPESQRALTIELEERHRGVAEIALVEREVHAGGVGEQQALERLHAGGVEDRLQRPALRVAGLTGLRLARKREQLV